jgi:hypothetical protein
MATDSSGYRRGFKAQCQRDAAEQRALLGLTPADRLDPRQLAAHHGIALRTPEDLPSLTLEHLAELTDESSGHPGAWSAVSLQTAQGHLTIYNPTHAPERINNSLSHELAHFLLGHPHGHMTLVDGHELRGYNEAHEREADWLAGVLLLPDTAIRHAARRGWGRDRTANHHQISMELVNWRWRLSGVDRYMPART